MSDPAKRIAPRVCLIYALFGLLWILATDLFTAWLSADARQVIIVETVKGALFVTISAALLYWYVRRQLRQQDNTNNALSAANAELRQQRDLLDSFINSLPGVAYVVDTEKRLRRWNRRFAEVTGLSPKELDHFDTRVLFTPEEAPIVQAGMMRAMTEGAASVEVNFLDRSGKPTPYYFTGVRAMLDGVPCMVGIGIDIAARKQRDGLLNGQKRVFEMIAAGAPAMQMYGDDANGALPTAHGSVPWTNTAPVPWSRSLLDYYHTTNVLRCPSMSRHYAQSPFNYFLGNRAVYVLTGLPGAFKLSGITLASQYILSGDTNWPFEQTDADPDNYSQDTLFSFVSPAHLGKVNILFADGHVRNYRKFEPSEMTYSLTKAGVGFHDPATAF